MARAKKENAAAADQAAENMEPGSVAEFPSAYVAPPSACECQRDRLWELYVARVAKAETVTTMRRDGRAIFRDAFIEAKVALEVYLGMTNEGGEK